MTDFSDKLANSGTGSSIHSIKIQWNSEKFKGEGIFNQLPKNTFLASKSIYYWFIRKYSLVYDFIV